MDSLQGDFLDFRIHFASILPHYLLPPILISVSEGLHKYEFQIEHAGFCKNVTLILTFPASFVVMSWIFIRIHGLPVLLSVTNLIKPVVSGRSALFSDALSAFSISQINKLERDGFFGGGLRLFS